MALTTALRDDSACASKSHHLPMSKSGKTIVLAAGCMSGVTNDICPTFSVVVASSQLAWFSIMMSFLFRSKLLFCHTHF